MPRYLIVRTFEIDEEAMPEVGRRSKEIAKEEFPEITWEHSHVAVRDNGSFKQFCVYSAPDPETLRSHGERVGAPHRRHLGDRRRRHAGRLPGRSLILPPGVRLAARPFA